VQNRDIFVNIVIDIRYFLEEKENTKKNASESRRNSNE